MHYFTNIRAVNKTEKKMILKEMDLSGVSFRSKVHEREERSKERKLLEERRKEGKKAKEENKKKIKKMKKEKKKTEKKRNKKKEKRESEDAKITL